MKKLLSLLLCLALLLSLSPVAFADDEFPEEPAPYEDAEPVEEPDPVEEEPEPPADEPSDPPADEPADDPSDDPAGGEDEGDVPGDPPAEGEPEYGCEPGEDDPAGDTGLEEDEQGEEPETEEAQTPLFVLVSFICDPQETDVTIFDSVQLPDGSWKELCSGLTEYELAPGEYVYDASCAGYYSKTKISLVVPVPERNDGGQPELTISVSLVPLEEEGALDEDAAYPRRTTPAEPLIVLPVSPDPARGTPKVFLQSDSRWAAVEYGYSNNSNRTTLAAAGCGILALTNAVNYLNGIFIEPSFAAEYSTGAGCHVEGGTRWDFYRGFAENYGVKCGIQYAGELYTYADLKNQLLNGCVAICSVPGHYMTIVDYDRELDRFLLLDSSPDDLRATGEGYVWISEQELNLMPSRIYETNGLVPRFVMLRAVGTLDVNGLLDGEASDALGDYGTFDVWIDGDKVANDQTEYSAVLPRGASYRIDDIRTKGAHRYFGVKTGALEGSIHSGAAAEIVLSFGTKDFMAEPVSDEAAGAPVEKSTPLVCARWAGGILGPDVSIPVFHP